MIGEADNLDLLLVTGTQQVPRVFSRAGMVLMSLILATVRRRIDLQGAFPESSIGASVRHDCVGTPITLTRSVGPNLRSVVLGSASRASGTPDLAEHSKPSSRSGTIRPDRLTASPKCFFG